MPRTILKTQSTEILFQHQHIKKAINIVKEFDGKIYIEEISRNKYHYYKCVFHRISTIIVRI
jgi:hypothetical protein